MSTGRAIPIEAEELCVRFETGLHIGPVTLRVAPRQWVCLIGPNGAGKTTLLKAIAGLVPHTGTVTAGSHLLSRTPPRHRAMLMAFVPQQPVIPTDMAVFDYVLLGRTPYIPFFGVESSHDRAVVGNTIDRLDLTTMASRPMGTLSGGETQRALLARALVQEAPVLLLDEPTSALDIGHQQQVLELIDGLRREQELTVVSTMHDLTHAGLYADRLVLMRDGRAIADGTPDQVLDAAALSEHYGARVRVERQPDGSVAVIPVRSRSR